MAIVDVLTGANDLISGAQRTIEVEHAEIHYGMMFSLSHFNASLAASGTINIEITTNSDYIHLKEISVANTEVYGKIELLEGHTSTGGTSLTAYNRNRVTTKATTATHKKDVSPTGGTVLQTFYSIGGTGVGTSRSGSGSTFKLEWLLNPNTKYLLRYTNASSNTCVVSMNLDYYG